MQIITILPMTGVGGQGGCPCRHQRHHNKSAFRLNDTLRTTFISGRVLLTAGVRALHDDERAMLLKSVSAFDGFTSGSDPYGEHDFGRVEVGGCGYFFKIDYYDVNLTHYSPDPADATVTSRVMTIMREDEY